MSLLERVIVAHRCRSTHHYIAFDALNRLQSEHKDAWRDLILVHHDDLLRGAKAPDAEFKDFKNHVLHVGEGEWGGARDSAMEWYANAVNALRDKRWSDGIYALGVMSHYYADPIQPFHTGQTEEEGAIHRAVEWSIAKSRDTILEKITKKGYPKVKAGKDAGFVSDMVRAGADRAHPHYQTFIDHYNVHAGSKEPRAGLDQKLIDILADLVGYATSGIAVLFDRAFEEAAIVPPKRHLTVRGYLATLDIPVRWITKKLDDADDQRTVTAMYKELEKTGKVIKRLPSDDKQIRALHCKQVLRKPIKELDAQPLKPLGTAHKPFAEYAELAAQAVAAFAEKRADAGKTAKPKKKVKAEKPAKAVKAAKPAKAPKVAKPAKVEKVAKVAPTKKASQAQRGPQTPPAIEKAAAKAVEQIKAETPDVATQPAVPEAWRRKKSETAVLPEALAEDIEIYDDTVVEQIEETPVFDAASEPEMTFSEEELAAFDTNLTDENGEMISELPVVEQVSQREAPPVDSFFDAVPEGVGKEARESRRGGLELEDPVIDAPSIGRKTAKRLNRVGIFTVEDLLGADEEEISNMLDVRHITADVLLDWQAQTKLMVEVPGLRVHDAQILTGAGIRSAEDLSEASARDIFRSAIDFLDTETGARIVRDDHVLHEEEVEEWIGLARDSVAA
ncbi:MAG: DUF4332 domain-containing protein [Hyphomonadaceae bacterium]